MANTRFAPTKLSAPLLYGKVSGGMTCSVSVRIGDTEAGRYTIGSDPGYEDYYVVEIPVGDTFRAGELARIYVDGMSLGEPVNVGDMGSLKRHDVFYDLPKQTKLLQNYPNPFNPETWIPYQLKEDASVEVRIYATTGQLVRILYLGHRWAGFHVSSEKAAHWDGLSDAGECVSSGIYIIHLEAGSSSDTRKMVLIR